MQLVEEFLSVLNQQHALIEQLSENKTGSKSLADKNVVKSPNSTFNGEVSSSKLNSTEKSRVKDASSIFISKFFEEQKRQRKDKAEKTLVSKINKPIKRSAELGSGSKSESGGWLDKLLGMLGLGFLKWSVLKGLIKKGLSKLLSKMKSILSSIWKGIKNAFGKVWSGIKGFFGKIWSGLKTLGSKIWNSKFVKGIRGIFGSIKTKITGIFKSLGRTVSGLWGKITNSKVYKAFTGIVDNAISAISGIFKGIKDKILRVVKTATGGISKMIPGGVKTAVGKTGGLIKAVGGKVVKGVSAVGGKVASIGKNVSSATANAAKKVVSKGASGVIKGSGGMLKLMGKLTAKGAAKIPVIGPAIESVLATMDIKAMKKSGMSESELQQKAGRRVVTGVSGMVGSASGALLAGALGSIIPGAGTAIGAILGAVGGDIAGRFLGGLITDHIIPKKYTKTIGAFVTGTTPPKDEMQDFIIKDGKVHKFNKRDEVMGMKTGGAINQFLHNTGGNNNAMKSLIKTNWKSMVYLQAIAQNTALMVNSLKGQSGGGNPIIVANSQSPQQPPSKQMTPLSNNRDGYLSSAYSLG